MKSFFALLAFSTSAWAAELTSDFKGPLGLQIYTLRESFKTNVPGTLEKVKDGTGRTHFDLLAAETKPEFVSVEMDVFWVKHAGQDPAKLLAKYPNRCALMRLKDPRRGAPTGIHTGHAPQSDDVPLGTGQVKWPTVLKQAAAVGEALLHEDESVAPLDVSL